jgi:hypothetical protein
MIFNALIYEKEVYLMIEQDHRDVQNRSDGVLFKYFQNERL